MSWSQFLIRQVKSPPLTFVHGMRQVVPRGVCCPMHSHRAIEIVYHPVGSGITRLEGGRTLSFEEGSAVVYAPQEVHDQVMDRQGEDLCVQLAIPARSRRVTGRCLLIPAVDDPALIEDIRLLSRGHVGIGATEQAIFNLRATSTLLALGHRSCNQRNDDGRNPSDGYILKAEQYIRDHFSEIQTMRQVADHVGISHDHLRHLFQAQRNKSLVRYLNEIRIARAKTLLLHSRLSLKEIAAMCGFRDVYYFSAVFRNFASTSPGRYRGA
ncbi:MAG: AraC family transcriptional regulator [Terrimicrobiaceae bacterium]|nr:AraC family transcriptional regulator [Terrimicrobiaceae bacterium]